MKFFILLIFCIIYILNPLVVYAETQVKKYDISLLNSDFYTEQEKVELEKLLSKPLQSIKASYLQESAKNRRNKIRTYLVEQNKISNKSSRLKLIKWPNEKLYIQHKLNDWEDEGPQNDEKKKVLP